MDTEFISEFISETVFEDTKDSEISFCSTNVTLPEVNSAPCIDGRSRDDTNSTSGDSTDSMDSAEHAAYMRRVMERRPNPFMRAALAAAMIARSRNNKPSIQKQSDVD